MNTQTFHPQFNAAHRAGLSIPARRAEFCWTPSYLNGFETAGEFTVLKHLDLDCCDYSMTWGTSFTYWDNLSDVDLLAEVLAVGMWAIVESEVPANRVIRALLRVPEVRSCARGYCSDFTEASRVNRLLSAGLQSIVIDGAPAKQVVASLRRDQGVRKWMRRYPNYLRY